MCVCVCVCVLVCVCTSSPPMMWHWSKSSFSLVSSKRYGEGLGGGAVGVDNSPASGEREEEGPMSS